MAILILVVTWKEDWTYNDSQVWHAQYMYSMQVWQWQLTEDYWTCSILCPSMPYIRWFMYADYLTTIFSIIYKMLLVQDCLDLYEWYVDSGWVGKHWLLHQGNDLMYALQILQHFAYDSMCTNRQLAIQLHASTSTHSPLHTYDYTCCGHKNKYRCYDRNLAVTTKRQRQMEGISHQNSA